MFGEHLQVSVQKANYLWNVNKCTHENESRRHINIQKKIHYDKDFITLVVRPVLENIRAIYTRKIIRGLHAVD